MFKRFVQIWPDLNKYNRFIPVISYGCFFEAFRPSEVCAYQFQDYYSTGLVVAPVNSRIVIDLFC